MKIKRLLKILGILIVAIILFISINYLFKRHHEVDYQLEINDQVYDVKEVYQDRFYHYLINVDDYQFSFSVKDKFNKKKKTIKDIESFDNDIYKCLYINDIDSNIVCSDKEINYSYETNKVFTQDFVNELIDQGYSNSSWDKNESNTSKLGSTSIYLDNIDKNAYLYVYKYNGFYVVNKDKQEELNILSKDQYNNTLGILVDKYYVMASYDDLYEYSKFYIIDITNNKIRELSLDKAISKDTSILGVVNNKLYLFDPDSIIEYELDPKKRSIKAIGDKDLGGKYYDTKWEDINIYDFKTKNLTFNYYDIPDISEYNSIYEYNDVYFYDIDENIYSYDSITKVKTFLVSLTGISSLKVVNDDLYFMRANTIYKYNNGNLLKILTYDELAFNPLARFEVYYK